MAHRINDKQIKAWLRMGEAKRHAVGRGLYFRVSAEGTGFWVVRYTVHERRREITIGRYGTGPGELSLADAAAEAAHVMAGVKKGIDPLAEKKRPATIHIRTVDELADEWLKDCDERLEHPEIPRRIYERDLSPAFGDLSLERIATPDIRAAVKALVPEKRTVANDALMYCKQLFNFGITLGLIKTNPAAPLKWSDAGGVEEARERVLSLDEIAEVFAVFRKHSIQYVRENYLATALFLVTGVRKGELVGARWSEFDLQKGLWDIPKERSKSGRAIGIPLPPVAVQWLRELKVRAYDSEYVLPARRRSKRFGHISPDTINAAITNLMTADKMGQVKLKVEHFTVHDLRRTYRTLLSQVGTPSHVAERAMNHAIKGVEGTYDRYDYLNERRDAAEKVAALISPIVDPMANVAEFRARKGV